MYKIKGADEREYGPIHAEQVRAWIAENRLNQYSLAQSEAEPGWKPLSQFPEFTGSFQRIASPVPPPAATPPPTSGDFTASSPSSSPEFESRTPSNSIGAYFASGSRESALNAVNAPGIGLIVVGALTILMSGVGLVMKNRLGGFWLGIIEQTGVPIDAAVRAQLQGTGGITALDIASMLFQLVLGALFLFSGIQMRKLVAWPLALTGAILAVVPCCSGCCCIGIPIGIWAIATLVRPEVKQSFN